MAAAKVISISDLMTAMKRDLELPLGPPPGAAWDAPWDHECLRVGLAPDDAHGLVWVQVEATRRNIGLLPGCHPSVVLEAFPFSKERLAAAMDLLGDVVGWIISHPDLEDYVSRRLREEARPALRGAPNMEVVLA